MKPIFFSLALLLVSKVDAINPVPTFTFVDPCTPFVFANAVQEKHGCYLFTAINGILPGQEQGTYGWKFGDGASASGSLVAHCLNPETVTTVFTGTVSYYSPAFCGVQPTDRTFTVIVPPIPTGSCIVSS